MAEPTMAHGRTTTCRAMGSTHGVMGVDMMENIIWIKNMVMTMTAKNIKGLS